MSTIDCRAVVVDAHEHGGRGGFRPWANYGVGAAIRF